MALLTALGVVLPACFEGVIGAPETTTVSWDDDDDFINLSGSDIAWVAAGATSASLQYVRIRACP